MEPSKKALSQSTAIVNSPEEQQLVEPASETARTNIQRQLSSSEVLQGWRLYTVQAGYASVPPQPSASADTALTQTLHCTSFRLDGLLHCCYCFGDYQAPL